MSSAMIKDLRKLFKEASGENIHLWCESLSAIMRYDSPECTEILAEEGFSEIENQATVSRNLLAAGVENPSVGPLVVQTLKQSVDELVLTKQYEVLDVLQFATSIISEEQKVEKLSKLNDAATPSIVAAIQQRYAPQPGAIPMLFAVFARKNDGYGQG
jgi:regulator of PEP synthase PpsR (kinase-PPPase family)